MSKHTPELATSTPYERAERRFRLTKYAPEMYKLLQEARDDADTDDGLVYQIMILLAKIELAKIDGEEKANE